MAIICDLQTSQSWVAPHGMKVQRETVGLLAHIYPVFCLHIILLPINLVKLLRIDAKARCVERTTASPATSYSANSA
jgi:hypothetical protein